MTVNWTPEAIRGLGATTDITTAGSILGVGRTLAFSLHRAGRFPVPVLKLGPQTYRVPVAPILALLGMTSDTGEAPAPPEAHATTDDRTSGGPGHDGRYPRAVG